MTRKFTNNPRIVKTNHASMAKGNININPDNTDSFQREKKARFIFRRACVSLARGFFLLRFLSGSFKGGNYKEEARWNIEFLYYEIDLSFFGVHWIWPRLIMQTVFN